MTRRLVQEDTDKIINNKSLSFFLPMVGVERFYEYRNLKGVFIWAEDYPDFEEFIFVLFKTSDLPEYKESLDRLKSFSNFAFSYTPDKFYDMLVFEPPSEYRKDYFSLKNGKYSEISEKYKRQIIKFHNVSNATDSKAIEGIKSLKGVLYKEEDYRIEYSDILGSEIPRGNELASVIDKSQETYLEEMKVVTNVNNVDLM